VRVDTDGRCACGQAVTCINNVIMGRLYIDHKGPWSVRGVQSGLSARMKFHATSMLTTKSRLHEVSCALARSTDI
jgi:hypothetical protein